MIKLDKIPNFNLRAEQENALRSAVATERAAAAAKRKGEIPAAIDAYERASNLYADSGLAFHGLGESELALEVRNAIRRCQKIASNLRHGIAPKRPASTIARPCCLACRKPLRRYKRDGQTMSGGIPMEWGDYGDNRFCGLTCGWRWACRTSVSPTK